MLSIIVEMFENTEDASLVEKHLGEGLKRYSNPIGKLLVKPLKDQILAIAKEMEEEKETNT